MVKNTKHKSDTIVFNMSEGGIHEGWEKYYCTQRAAYWIVITEEMNHLHIYEKEKYSGDLRRDKQDLKII